MVLRSLIGAGLVAWLGVAPAAALPGPKESWVEVHTENFVLVGDASDRLVVKVGLNLERLRKSLSLLFDVRVGSPLPSTIYVFKGPASFGRYVDAGDPEQPRVGLFTGHPDGNYVAINAGRDVDPFDVIYHEYIHYYLHNASTTPVPTWFDEGLAEFYSTFEVNENQVEIGRPVARHVYWLRAHPPIPLERLFTITTDSPEYNEADKSGLFYAESWALVHYLISGNKERATQLSSFLQALEAGRPVDDAFGSAFGTSYDALLEELKSYVKTDSYAYTRYTLDELAVDEDAAVTPLDRADVLYRLGDYLAHSGPDRAAEAEEHFRAALEIRPDHPGALAGLGFLLDQAERHEEAAALYERSLALDASSFMSHLLYGRFLISKHARETVGRIEPGATLPSDLAAARDHLRRAIELNPGLARAYALFGYTYLLDPGDPGPGIRALKKALSLMPRSEEAAFNLLVLYLHAGDRDAARGIEQSLARNGRDPEILKEAREALLRDEVEDAQTLLEQGKIDEGLAALRSVRERTADPELRTFLDGLISRGDVVRRFNHVIDIGKQGDLAGAERQLSELIPEIGDPELRAQAQELLARIRELRKRKP